MLTRHGAARLAKRSGVGHKGVQKLATEALERGVPRDATKGNLRRYLDRLFFSHASALLLVYAENVYVFGGKDGPLITMYSLPGNLKHRKAARAISHTHE